MNDPKWKVIEVQLFSPTLPVGILETASIHLLAGSLSTQLPAPGMFFYDFMSGLTTGKLPGEKNRIQRLPEHVLYIVNKVLPLSGSCEVVDLEDISGWPDNTVVLFIVHVAPPIRRHD